MAVIFGKNDKKGRKIAAFQERRNKIKNVFMGVKGIVWTYGKQILSL
jgi:hypothetical protein